MDRELQIEIDPELKALIPPHGEEERAGLERDLLRDGCRDPLAVWRQKGGKAVLLDGHTRLEICRKHNLRYTIVVLELASREEAKRWIIENQLHRRNLNEAQRALLAAQIANLPAHRPGDATAHSCAVTQSAAAAKHAVSRRTVQHATRVLKHGSPKLREASKRGVIPASVASLITKLPHEDQDRIADQCLGSVTRGPRDRRLEGEAAGQEKEAGGDGYARHG